MYLVQKVYTRPNTDVLFYPGEDAYHAYFCTTYRDTGKCSELSVTVSQDKLKLLLVSSWESEEVFHNVYLADPIVQAHLAARSAYSIANNITTTDRVTTQL